MRFEQFIDKCKELKMGDEIIIVGRETCPLNPFKVEYPYTLKIKSISTFSKYGKMSVTIADFNNEELVWIIDNINYNLIDFPINRKSRIDNLNL